MRNVVNFVAFQICWLACVLGAARGMPLLGVAVVGGWAIAHLAASEVPVEREAGLMLAAAVLGLFGDSVLALGGWIEFPAHARLGEPTTVWMVALWVAFATTLGHSLRWLRGRYWLGALGGAIFGPLAYWAGARLGAVTMLRGAESLAAVAALWTLAIPALLAVQGMLERRLAPPEEAC